MGKRTGLKSVLLDTGEAFVGDLAMNRFPLRYAARESVRLVDQATALADILHSGTDYPEGSNV